MNIKGSCTLGIVNSNLTKGEISSSLNLLPTTTIEKGQMISETLKKKSDASRWLYKEPIQEGEQVSKTLSRLLNRIDARGIHNVIKHCEDCFIGVYINSEYGQIGFELPSETIILLSKLGIRLDIHILSFGMVDDN
ncbi:DUF4279 domain-containing protein [Paenibacillus sanguinis]|uniref:DUF4279 domain-containing protein n=1 Tax=Paenibacillus sanguinis TaxID=225906 RepID=UPI00035D889D|nr:DUF4279 domain-containing protein [Paenibacillus sanguinis]